MLAFPVTLVDAAKEAGMKVPADPDKFEMEEFPHFAVFCFLQLGRKMQAGEHWENAKIIADIPEKRLKEMFLEDFLRAGLRYSQ